MLLLCAYVALFLGVQEVEAVKLSVAAPSEGSRILAPTRDFYAIVGIDREGKNPEQEPFNVRFELYRKGVLTPVRTVTSAVDDSTGITPLAGIRTDYPHGWTPGTALDILTSPPPDLVYNPALPVSIYDASLKAVVMRHYVAALIQGGRTKEFDSNYSTIYTQDLEEGEYTLKVTAVGAAGAELYSSSIDLTFGSVPDKILSRFSPAKHLENVTAFAQANNAHIYMDLFPGYWDASKLPHGGVAGTLFYEITRRWRPNDLVEYLNGTIRGVVYNINATSSSQSVEIGGLAYAGRLGSDVVRWYHYDIGDMEVRWNAGGGQVSSKSGAIVPFPEGRRLVITRGEIRGSGETEIIPSDYVYNPEHTDKSVDWNLADGVAVKPRQLLSLFGVVKPLQPALEDVIPSEDGTFTVNNRIATLNYGFFDGSEQVFFVQDKRVELTRIGVNENPSIYEFRHDIPVPEDFEKNLTVRVSAFDSRGNAVPGTETTFTLVRYSSGGGGGGGCMVGPAPFEGVGILLLFILLGALRRLCAFSFNR